MYVTVHFPLADARPFISSEHGRLARPPWPHAVEGRDYVRSFGQVRRRWKGGLVEWDGEQRFCTANNAIKTPQPPDLRERGLRLLTRRLYRPTDYAARLEIGFRPILQRDIIYDLDAILSLPISVPIRSKPAVLHHSEKIIALQYLLSTTRRVSGQPHPCQTWWISPGAKQLIVEYSEYWTKWSHLKEIKTFPDHTNDIDEFEGIKISHCWFSADNQPISVWYIGTDPISKKLGRRFRLNLARLHTEHETLKCILSLIVQGKLAVDPRTELADALTIYLRDSIRFLLHPPKSVVGSSSPLMQVIGMTELIQPGERDHLLKQIKGLRRNIVRMVEDVTKPERLRYSGLMITNAYFGDYTVNDQSVRIAGSNITVGNVAVASAIQGSFNTVERSDAKQELKVLLATLHKDFANIVKHLPPAAADAAARDLQGFSAEAVASSPRRNLLEITSSGLVEAAKTVAEFAVPVMTTVKGILSMLGFSQ